LLVHKGLPSVDDIEIALRESEANVTSDERTYDAAGQSRRHLLSNPSSAVG